MSTDSTQANKELVIAFFDRALNKKDPEGAAAAALSDPYTQHNPTIADGVAGFLEFARGLHAYYPNLTMETKRAVAEGDLVVTHSRTEFEPGGYAVVSADFWRVVDGKIVEHWDSIQEIPAASINDNGVI